MGCSLLSDMDYFEKDLEIPFLRVLSEYNSGLPMSKIKAILLDRLHPSGTSAESSPSRAGEIKLHQRIGNFTLERRRRIFVRGYVTYNASTKIYQITEKGMAFLQEKEPIYDSLRKQGFSDTQIEKEAKNDYRDVVIEEGTAETKNFRHRQRSQKLRQAAINVYKNADGTISCKACNSELSAKYGERGKGCVEMHHTQSVHTYDESGIRQRLKEALKKIVPLCPNCHRIVHRGGLISIGELKRLIHS